MVIGTSYNTIVVQCKQAGFTDRTTWGITNFYDSMYSGLIDPQARNWGFVRIQLSDYHDVGIGTISHEIGHALGLSHRITKYDSIMRQGSPPRTVDTPQQVDFDVVNHLYGY